MTDRHRKPESVSWGFVLERYRERVPEPWKPPGLDKTNTRIAAWLQLRECNPTYAREVA